MSILRRTDDKRFGSTLQEERYAMDYKTSNNVWRLLAGALCCWSFSAATMCTAFMLPAIIPSRDGFVAQSSARSHLLSVPTTGGGAALATKLRITAAGNSPDGESGEADEYTVFDAGGQVSWEKYKKNQPNEYKLSETDKMLCWQNDECLVEDESKYTKAWRVRSAERDPTTETHFDSEGDWEEEDKSAWSKKWFEDVGADDLHEEPNLDPEGYVI